MANLKGKISVQEARTLHENWVATRAQYIKDELGNDDPFEFVFSVRELKQYLEEIEANSLSTNPGVRVYLGAYIADGGKNEATVFFAPTDGTSAESQNNYSIEPLNRGMNRMPP